MNQTKNNLLKSCSANKITFFTSFGKAAKIPIFILFALCTIGSVQAQEDTEFNRDGRWLVETGYNIISSVTGGGTGVNFLVDTDGNNVTSVGAEVGKFTSQNFALKFRFGLLSGGGFSLTNFGVGGKYYIAGNVPIDFGGGVLNGGGDSAFQGNLGIGYAINMAANITLEPSLGAIITEDEVLINFKIGFAMFL